MVRIISALILAVTAVCASAAEPLKLVDNPPDRHVVVRGDTLWGISGKFLKEPWRWPEIWNMNREEIKNPHLIYPGQVVYLDRSGKTPRLRLGKPVKSGSGTVKLQPHVYSDPVQQAIPSIPPNQIEPFLSQPLVVEQGELDTVPRIVAGPGIPRHDGQWRSGLRHWRFPMPASCAGTSSAPASRSSTRIPAPSSAMKPSSSAMPIWSSLANRPPSR